MTDAEKLVKIREKLEEFNKDFDEDEVIDWGYGAVEMCRELIELIDA